MLTLDHDEFFEAVKTGNLAKVNQLVDNAPGLLNAKHESGATGILLALYSGHQEMAEFLAKRKTDIDIFEATSLGKVEQVRALLRQNPGLAKVYSAEGFTALQLAAYLGRKDAVNLLLNAEAEVNAIARNPSGYTALSGAVSRGHLDI